MIPYLIMAILGFGGSFLSVWIGVPAVAYVLGALAMGLGLAVLVGMDDD